MTVLKGSYRFRHGAFSPDTGMVAINARVAAMRLLADRGDGVPSFYLDPSDGTFWERQEFEDYRQELRPVSRAYIESQFPTVDPDRPLPKGPGSPG